MWGRGVLVKLEGGVGRMGEGVGRMGGGAGDGVEEDSGVGDGW